MHLALPSCCHRITHTRRSPGRQRLPRACCFVGAFPVRGYRTPQAVGLAVETNTVNYVLNIIVTETKRSQEREQHLRALLSQHRLCHGSHGRVVYLFPIDFEQDVCKYTTIQSLLKHSPTYSQRLPAHAIIQTHDESERDGQIDRQTDRSIIVARACACGSGPLGYDSEDCPHTSGLNMSAQGRRASGNIFPHDKSPR